MTSYNENQSTGLFSRDIRLVHSNNWKTYKNLNQNYSTPSSFSEQEDNSKSDNVMSEKDWKIIFNEVFGQQILPDEEKENDIKNEKIFQKVEQNNNVNDKMQSLSKRKRKRGEKKREKKRGTRDYYIKSFLSNLLNKFVLRELNDRIKKCKLITIRKNAKIKKFNYKTNIATQIERL